MTSLLTGIVIGIALCFAVIHGTERVMERRRA